MIRNVFKKLVIGVFAGVIVLFGSLVANPTANAQVRVVRVAPTRVFIGPRFFGPGFYPYYYPYYRVYDPIAYQRESGFSDELSRGKSDAHHGKAFAPDSHHHYRDSHSITYREAFLQGYRTGYREYRG